MSRVGVNVPAFFLPYWVIIQIIGTVQDIPIQSPLLSLTPSMTL